MKTISLIALVFIILTGCTTLSTATFRDNVGDLKFEYPVPKYWGASMVDDIKEKLVELSHRKGYATYKVLSCSEGTKSNITTLGRLAAGVGGINEGSQGRDQPRPTLTKEVIYLKVEFN